MSSTARQNNLLLTEDWQKIYQSFKNADFQSYDFDNLRRIMIDYLRTNFPEDFNDYTESSEYLALIDLIAYVGQSIAYRVDLNARENFLELAERRDSVLRLARLISYNPKRNQAATGLLKFQTVQTSESILDSNGRNLSGQFVNWNDSSNPNWYDQFIKIINAALPNTHQFGTPIDSAHIYGIPTAQYRFNMPNTDVPIHGFTKTIAGRSMDFEITSTTFNNKPYIYEEAPTVGNKMAFVYSDDGYGANSPGTGFFFNVTQGSLNQGTFSITQPSTNEVIDIAAQNINNTDVWLYSLNAAGKETTLWTQVPALSGNNVIYNSLAGNIKDIYSVITRVGDAASLSFSDGTFGKLPLGSFRVYYRISNNLSYTINPSDINNVTITIPYTSVQGQTETLTIALGLATSIANATTSETNDSVKANAPQTYYTQNRMITGEDYNISPLSVNQQVAKVKAINRTSSGISRYFDLIDPTGKYSSTNLFADDGVVYQQNTSSSSTFTFTTRTDVQDVIYNTVFDLLATPGLRDFFYANYVATSAGNDRVWTNITTDSSTSSGYISTGGSAVPVGPPPNSTDGAMILITPGALIRFDAPSGYYFNTKKGNALTLIPSSGLPSGSALTIWTQVVSVSGDGTASTSAVPGILSTGFGPIVLNKVIPAATINGASPILTKIIPEFNTVISPSVITTMIDLVMENSPFGLRYEPTSQSWQIVFETNLNITSDFNPRGGDTTNTRADASWLLLFTTNNEFYTLTARTQRYVFESDQDITFYFDSKTRIYDSISRTVITDAIKVLSINTQPDSSTIPFTQDLNWRIVSEYIGLDGYVDPKKIVVSFADTDNNGIVDDPELFTSIVGSGLVAEIRYTISDGQEDYKYVANDFVTGKVIAVATDANVGSSVTYPAGQYFYITSTQVVKKFDSNGNLVPTLDYKVYAGRDALKFQYIHNADYDSRIDPGTSNIMDIFVLTNSYDTQFRQWLAGANVSEPKPPSSDELNSMLAPSLNVIKAMSDEVIYHPVSYKLLFGAGADETLQATFNVIMNPSSTASNADVTARILAAMNQFFALSNWDFGDTFYFTELATYVMNQLAPDITNFVIVPKKTGQFFGSLFEIKCPSNQIFLSSATADDIIVVAGLTSTNLKTVTGVALNTVVTQQITSANFGANN